jgi:hypothetical protein
LLGSGAVKTFRFECGTKEHHQLDAILDKPMKRTQEQAS